VTIAQALVRTLSVSSREMAFRIAFVLSLVLSASAICDDQRSSILLVCNSACQYSAQQTSTGCGLLFSSPCYQCCWQTCLTTTIQGGTMATCGTMVGGTQVYEDCAIGGSCLTGHCPLDPGGGSYDDAGSDDNRFGGGAIAGTSIGSFCFLILLYWFLRWLFCKPKVDSSQVELTPGSHL